MSCCFIFQELAIQLFSISGCLPIWFSVSNRLFRVIEIFRFILAIDDHLPVAVADRPFIGRIITERHINTEISGLLRFNVFCSTAE